MCVGLCVRTGPFAPREREREALLGFDDSCESVFCALLCTCIYIYVRVLSLAERLEERASFYVAAALARMRCATRTFLRDDAFVN